MQAPSGLGCCLFYGGSSSGVDLQFIVTPIGGSVFIPCLVLKYFLLSSFAIILMGKVALVAFL